MSPRNFVWYLNLVCCMAYRLHGCRSLLMFSGCRYLVVVGGQLIAWGFRSVTRKLSRKVGRELMCLLIIRQLRGWRVVPLLIRLMYIDIGLFWPPPSHEQPGY